MPSRWLTGVLVALAAGVWVFLGVRLLGLDWFSPAAQLVAFTPYLVLAGLLAAVAAAGFRRWRIAVVGLLSAVVAVSMVAPRMVSDQAPANPAGVELRVMTANLWHGNAVAPLMSLIRRERPDVLSLQEVDQAAADRLERAGLRTLLPHRAARLAPGVAGTALYAREPFSQLRTFDPRTRFDMARASIRHQGVALDLVAAHPSPPVPGDAVADWRRELGWLTRTADEGVLTVLAGDFNATLDHSGFRRLLDAGFIDAADAAGRGLAATWQAGWVPPVTLDHVLVESRPGAAVRAVRVHPIPGSDHRAVVADLRVPG